VKRVHCVADDLLSSAEAEKLLQAYDLMDVSDAGTQKNGLLELISDLRFYFPVLKASEGLLGVDGIVSYRYSFHQVRVSFQLLVQEAVFDFLEIAQPYARTIPTFGFS
jgi:hypothetical protein